jgi:hypothetical protein
MHRARLLPLAPRVRAPLVLAPLVLAPLVLAPLVLAPLVLAPLVLALGCEAPTRPDPAGPARSPADKAALFGDPSLVPTREGERARREVALAHEIEQALAVLPSVGKARVDVELPDPAAAEGPRVLAVVQRTAAADDATLSPRVRAIAHAVVGRDAAVELVVEASPAPASPPTPTRWPLVLGVLGLGFFGGIMTERLRGLRGARTARLER